MSLPKKIACYDSGFGLSVCPDLGEGSVPTTAVVHSRIFKVRLPGEAGEPDMPFEVWDKQFQAQKNLLNAMVEAYNEKMAKVS